MTNKLKTPGQRIAWRLAVIGSKPYQAAKAIGYSSSYLYRIINGKVKTLPLDFGVKIAKFMRCSVNWLATGENTCEISIVKGAEYRRITDNQNEPLLWQGLPVITWDEAAKITIKLGQDIPERKGRFKVPDLTANTSLNNFALIMRGDSMVDITNQEESFRDGLILYFDPSIRPYIGCYVLARDTQQNEAYFRRLALDCSQVVLVAHNRIYPAIKYGPHISINGVLVNTYRRYEHVFNPVEMVKNIKYLDELV